MALGSTPPSNLSRIESYPLLETAMRTTQQLSITLPKDMAEMVRTKV